MQVLIDMHRLGPAPTWQRELAAAAGNVLLLLVLAGVVLVGFGRPVPAGVVTLVVAGWVAGRLLVAARRGRGDGAGVPR